MKSARQYQDDAKRLIHLLKKKGITHQHILNVMGKIPRHLFVNEAFSTMAYEDNPLPIGKAQTISQPYTVAFQTQLLALLPGEKVLEIGTGSGYQTAVLCEMEVNVYSIERIYELYINAQYILNKLGYAPSLFYSDGYEGLPEYAPFNKILVTTATSVRPEKLLQQLSVGGWMVVPLGGYNGQRMTVIRRSDHDQFIESEHGLFNFVPMRTGIER